MEYWNIGKQRNINNTKRCAMALWNGIIFFTQRRKDATKNSISPFIHFFFLVFLLFSLVSCQTKTNNLQVSRVDSISFRMEETAKVYYEIDTLKIDSFYTIVLFNFNRLGKMKIQESNELLLNYGTLKKGFKEFIKRRPYTLEELEFCRKQINDLREDAENGLLTDEDFELFLKHEANASQSLRVQMSYYQARIAAQVKKFEQLNPRIDSLVNTLNY